MVRDSRDDMTMKPASPYPRGLPCSKCGETILPGQRRWCRRERPELKTACWIITFSSLSGLAAFVAGGSLGGAASILQPFGMVVFLGALLSGLCILADELRG